MATKPRNPLNLPWYMFDIYNAQLITSATIPMGNISDVKDVFLTETPIPGLGFSPINQGGFGTRKVSFTLPLVKKGDAVGNLLMLKQFDNLRNPAFGANPSNIFRPSTQFTPNPKVLFFWGSGSGVPLEWWVKKCDPVHRPGLVNRMGFPQYSEIQIELWLDETSPLFKAEETFRKISSYIGMAQGAASTTGAGRRF